LQEMHGLNQNIEHINRIVAMQQTYAKVAGVVEKIALSELVDSALSLNFNSFHRHGVEVERDYENIPEVILDKHKLLQILINLLKNARHACDDHLREGKRIVVRITRRGTNRVGIEITDNGTGIAPENLTRIFSHGFTTRKDGHGFGLHSGALAATEMGGALMAQSDGPGKGATFILELPLHPPREEAKAASKAPPSENTQNGTEAELPLFADSPPTRAFPTAPARTDVSG